MTGERLAWGIPGIAILAAIALSGCGNSGTAGTAASTTTTRVAVALGSPAIHGTELPAAYTCDGRNVSPPLTWGTVPAGVQELALFAVGTRPSGTGGTVTSVEWAMAGLKPTLHGLRSGQVPLGAFLLTGTDGKQGYSICPHRGQTESYTFGIFALPRIARASPGLPGPVLLYNLTSSSPEDAAPAGGVFSVSYTRR